MSEKRRQKGKNFTNQEISLLLDLLERFLIIIENKRTDANTVKQKNEAWIELTQIFNAQNNNEERTVVQLKTFYDNFKRKKRKENADNNVLIPERQYQTSDGSFIKKIDSHGERLIKMLKQYKSEKNIDDNDQDSNSLDLEVHENDDIIFENIKQENNENDSYKITKPISIIYEETQSTEQLNDISRPSCSNSYDPLKFKHLKKRKTETASTVYKELAKFTAAKTAKKNYESEYFKLKLAYKKQMFERKLEMDKEFFQLEKRKIENDLKLQKIKIEQEMITLQKMKQGS